MRLLLQIFGPVLLKPDPNWFVVHYYILLLKGQFTPGTKSGRYIWDVKRKIINTFHKNVLITIVTFHVPNIFDRLCSTCELTL